MRFTPKSAGTKTFNLTYTFLDQDGSGNSCVDVFTFQVSNHAYETPIVTSSLPIGNSQNSCGLKANSSINLDTLSLQETLSLAKSPFHLSYSSDHFRLSSNFTPQSLGLGGWSPSLLHHYDVTKKIFYSGDGGTRAIQAVTNADGSLYLTDPSGSEIYFFDSNGMHLRTQDVLTAVVKYTFIYDLDGRILKITDQFGNATTFISSAGGAVISSPYGQVTTLVFDANGFLSSLTNANSETYRMSSTPQGLLTSFQKPMGQASQVTYDSSGFVTKDLGAGGDFISLVRSYDSTTQAQNVSATTALGVTTGYFTQASDGQSSTHQSTLPYGGKSISQSNEVGPNSSTDIYQNKYNFEKVFDPIFGAMAAYIASSTYVVANSSIQVSTQTIKRTSLINPNDPLSFKSIITETTLQSDPQKTYISTYEAAKRELTQVSPLGRSNTLGYDATGLVRALQVGNLEALQFGYDQRGRLISTTQGNRQTTQVWDASGNLVQSTDALGRATRFQYDPLGRVTQQTLPDNSIIQAGYDKNGNLTSVTPPSRPAHILSYNLMDLVSIYLPPSIAGLIDDSTHFSWNLDQKLAKITQPDGSSVDYNYDPKIGQLNSIHTAAGDFTYQYLSSTDLVSQVSSPKNEKLNYSYVGNLMSSVIATGSVQSQINYFYNTDASVASIQVLGAPKAAAFTYDQDSLVSGVLDETILRNSFGGISQTNVGKVKEMIEYDPYGQIIKDSFISGKKTYSQNYERDRNGRIIRAGSDQKTNYRYDLQGRLERVSSGRKILREYQYDQNGNRIRMLRDENSIDAQYDNQDRLIRYGSNDYKYNSNGHLSEKIERSFDGDRNLMTKIVDLFELKHKQKTTQYKYDFFGNLLSVVLPNKNQIDYVIDGQNRRVGKKINSHLINAYVYQNQYQIAAELDDKGHVVKQFIFGSKSNVPDLMLANGKEYRIISDQVGTPKFLVDTSSGKFVKRFNFDEFGVSRGDVEFEDQEEYESSLNLPFGFAGGLADSSTGLVRFGARDYDPEVGRWLSKDPILFNGRQTNLYGYAFNNPITFIDPSGLEVPEDGAGGGQEEIAIPQSSSGGTVYVAPNGQAILTPQGTTFNPASNGNGTVYNIPGGTQIRLMGPTDLSPNGYGKININGQFMGNNGTLLPPGSGNSPAAHIQPNCPIK